METAALTKRCTGDAVAAPTSKKAPQAVVVKDFEPSEVLNTHRPRLAAVEQKRPDQDLVNAILGLERYLASGPQCVAASFTPYSRFLRILPGLMFRPNILSGSRPSELMLLQKNKHLG